MAGCRTCVDNDDPEKEQQIRELEAEQTKVDKQWSAALQAATDARDRSRARKWSWRSRVNSSPPPFSIATRRRWANTTLRRM